MIDFLLGMYVEGGVGYVKIPENDLRPYVFQMDGVKQVLLGGVRVHDYNQAANPMGRIAVGHEWESGPFRVSLELRHESWIATAKDKGTNSAWGSVRYFPFR